MERAIAEIDLKKLRVKESRYPYLCIRPMMSGFLQLPIEPCQYMQLTHQIREELIVAVSHEARIRKYRSCVIFSEDDCVYCEVDGRTWQTDEPPCRGFNFGDLNALVTYMQQKNIEDGFGLSESDIGTYS